MFRVYSDETIKGMCRVTAIRCNWKCIVGQHSCHVTVSWKLQLGLLLRQTSCDLFLKGLHLNFITLSFQITYSWHTVAVSILTFGDNLWKCIQEVQAAWFRPLAKTLMALRKKQKNEANVANVKRTPGVSFFHQELHCVPDVVAKRRAP